MLEVDRLEDCKDKVLDDGKSEDLKVLFEDLTLGFVFLFLVGGIFQKLFERQILLRIITLNEIEQLYRVESFLRFIVHAVMQ